MERQAPGAPADGDSVFEGQYPANDCREAAAAGRWEETGVRIEGLAEMSNPRSSSPVYITSGPGGVVLTHLSAAGSVLVKDGAGSIASISVNTPGTGSLTLIDGLGPDGAVLGVLDLAKSNAAAGINWPFEAGLYVVVTGSGFDVTIVAG